jgi:hypothetical protein
LQGPYQHLNGSDANNDKPKFDGTNFDEHKGGGVGYLGAGLHVPVKNMSLTDYATLLKSCSGRCQETSSFVSHQHQIVGSHDFKYCE